MPAELELKWSEKDRAIVRSFQTFMESEGWDLKAASQRLRKSVTVVSLMLHERYTGAVAEISRQMLRTMHRARARKSAPPPPRFCRTYIAEQIHGILRLAHEDRDLHVVLGAAGVGKTRSAQEYAIAEPDVLTLVIRPGCTPRPILQRLGKLCGVAWAGTCFATADALVAALKDSDRLLICDDADWLAPHVDTLTFFRLICEEARIGLVLLATPLFLEGLNRRTNGAVAQFLDRALVWSLGEAPASDLREVLKGSDVRVNDAALTLLTKACQGSIRRGVKALRAATRLSKDCAVKVADVEAALGNLTTL